MGILLNIRFPGFIGKWLTRTFAKIYKINLNEAEGPIEAYKSIGDLFIRKLKPGLRPVKGDLVHPVDAVISQMGKIQDGTLIQAKGKTYTTKDLLRLDDVSSFENGLFITYYLCPTDYHRIHSPVTGVIKASRLIPGKLWPVNEWSVSTINNLFSVNERMISFIETREGNKVAVVKVGATNVGKITLSYDDSLISNQMICSKEVIQKTYEPAITTEAGEELGIFHMGSTVVLILDKEIAKKVTSTKPGPVKMGEKLD